VRNGAVVTALSVEHSFSNCPQGAFYALMRSGNLSTAMKLRLLWLDGLLPSPHGVDDSNYKYPKAKARLLWNSIRFSRGPQHRRTTLSRP
jgi:hypothetical protein